ncbi:sulfur carrier protein [Kribbella steppae]|uniref:Sulfur carrier protein n=1 Tax=Kribbella steppae TaxID=2512223 RepID=A0A4V2RY03_9ACTN|nr:sulfur carrier protein ThiS [Kribbella steppae]TCO16609.1 sulfur carrier protein [Kribbella steppae]
MAYEVWVNGTATSVPPNRSVADLVREYSDRQTGIAVALNQTVLTRDEWAGTTLTDGDRVEIVSAVQGG